MMTRLDEINRRIAEIEALDSGTSTSTGRTPDMASDAIKRTVNAMVVIDREICLSCGLCVDLCPEEAISMNDTVTVDPDKCTGCGTCVEECPNEAISMVYVTPKSAAP
jgi:Pyruvate/2-oxoacid:ferredoxin oxidoreductase delta subunit